jgi:hypothetical protein
LRSTESIWLKVKAQVLLGEEDFVKRLNAYVRGREGIREIPRGQRYMARPDLKTLFSEKVLREKGRRDGRIVEAIERHGYSQKEVADYLGMHYSTISRAVSAKREGMSIFKT